MENNKHHDENHHIVSYAFNIKVWIVLLILTWLTITVAYLNFGNLAVAIALLIATVKAGGEIEMPLSVSIRLRELGRSEEEWDKFRG